MFFATNSNYRPDDYVFTHEDSRPPHPDTIRQRFDRPAAVNDHSRAGRLVLLGPDLYPAADGVHET